MLKMPRNACSDVNPDKDPRQGRRRRVKRGPRSDSRVRIPRVPDSSRYESLGDVNLYEVQEMTWRNSILAVFTITLYADVVRASNILEQIFLVWFELIPCGSSAFWEITSPLL